MNSSRIIQGESLNTFRQEKTERPCFPSAGCSWWQNIRKTLKIFLQKILNSTAAEHVFQADGVPDQVIICSISPNQLNSHRQLIGSAD